MFLYMSEEKHVTFHKHYVFKRKINLFFPFKGIMLVNIAVHIAMNNTLLLYFQKFIITNAYHITALSFSIYKTSFINLFWYILKESKICFNAI